MLLCVTMLGAGACDRTDPSAGRAGSDVPPGPLTAVPETSPPPAEPCTSLAVTKGRTEGAAGSQYLRLSFTNRGTTACQAHGYPTLTLRDGSGRPVGQSAELVTSGAAKYLLLEPGDSAYADVRFPNPDNFEPGRCTSGTAKLEVIGPGASQRAFIDDDHDFCPGWSVSALYQNLS